MIRSWREAFWLYFCGICMGVSDLVPGVSGGTVAFIMGFYEDLIHAIKSIKINSKVEWKFLLFLFSGIATAFVLFSRLIHQLLDHPVYQIYLYTTFMGLILASAIYCGKQLTHWHVRYVLALVVGALGAYVLTQSGILVEPNEVASSILNPWVIFCGACAASAMLLPGVSGSYILVVLGLYPSVIKALSTLVHGLWEGGLDISSFLLLANLGIGILFGLVFFSRVISWLLDHRHHSTLALLTGFMLGALPSVYPLGGVERSEPAFWIAIGCGVIGFIAVLGIDFLVRDHQSA